MFQRKILSVVTLALLIILSAASVNAQVLVKLSQPPPNQWQVEDMWQLTLTNTSQESYNVYLYGTVEEAGAGLIFKGTSAPFELQPSFSGPVKLDGLEPVEVEYPNGDYEDIVQKTGTLPAGTYTICVYVKGADGKELGHDCKIQIITHPYPPELINPVDEATVTEKLPVFSWLPPMPLSGFVTYNIKLVELLDGQTPMEAMEANLVWFEETGIQSTSFQYPISARAFESGKAYCWQVKAESYDYFIAQSEVWTFSTLAEHKEKVTLVVPFRLNSLAIARYSSAWTFRIDAKDVTPRLPPEKLNEKTTVKYGETLTSGDHTIAFAFYSPDGHCVKYIWSLNVKITDETGDSVKGIEIDEIVFNGKVRSRGAKYIESENPPPLIEYSKERVPTEPLTTWECKVDMVRGYVCITRAGTEGYVMAEEGMLLGPDDVISTGLPKTQPQIIISGTYGSSEFKRAIDEPIIQGKVRDLVEWFMEPIELPEVKSGVKEKGENAADDDTTDTGPCPCICICEIISFEGVVDVIPGEGNSEVSGDAGYEGEQGEDGQQGEENSEGSGNEGSETLEIIEGHIGLELGMGDEICTGFESEVRLRCTKCSEFIYNLTIPTLSQIVVPEDCFKKWAEDEAKEVKLDIGEMEVEVKKGLIMTDLEVSPPPNHIGSIAG